jgi:shikimate kinase
VRPPLNVVVTGMPAAGKTTVAESLSGSLSLPLVAKDTVKELHESLGTGNLFLADRLEERAHRSLERLRLLEARQVRRGRDHHESSVR